MYKDLYQSLPDPKAYLRRIHFAADTVNNTETLNELVFSHLKTVPFENLDVLTAEKELPLGIEALFDKIVIRRRGGFCFELNALFLSLLKALSLDCWSVMARVVWNKTFLPPHSHRANIVRMDGHLWLCDVGYGGPAPAGIVCLDTTEVQPIRGTNFRAEITDGTATVYREHNGTFGPLLTFGLKPNDPVDFIPLSFHQTLSPTSFFRKQKVISVHTDTGNKVIDGDTFRIRENGVITKEMELSTPELFSSVLEKEFGIILP